MPVGKGSRTRKHLTEELFSQVRGVRFSTKYPTPTGSTTQHNMRRWRAARAGDCCIRHFSSLGCSCCCHSSCGAAPASKLGVCLGGVWAQECPVPDHDNGETIVRVLNVTSGSRVEIERRDGSRGSCILPSKYNKRVWLKRGGFVIVKVSQL